MHMKVRVIRTNISLDAGTNFKIKSNNGIIRGIVREPCVILSMNNTGTGSTVFWPCSN